MKLPQSALKHSLISSLIYAILLLLSQIAWDNQSFHEAIKSTAFSSIVFGILTDVYRPNRTENYPSAESKTPMI